MSIITETAHAGGFIVSEPDVNLSRKVGMIAGNDKHLPGTVLGQLTVGGNYVPLAPGEDDGSQNAAAILFDHVDATDAPVPGVVVHALASVNGSEIIWPPGIDDNTKATAIAALAAKNIVVMNADPLAATVEPTRLIFATVPAGGEEATDLGAVTVRVENDQGILMTGDNATQVTLTKATGPGNLTVTPNATVTVSGGIATFTGIEFDQDGSYTLTASAAGLDSDTSSEIVVTPAA